MKEKGFTLVELLAVIVIIGLLATIALPQVLNQFSNQTAELTKNEIALIEQGASNYAMENGREYKGKISCVEIKKLVEEEAIDSNLAKNAEVENLKVFINYSGDSPITSLEQKMCSAIQKVYEYYIDTNNKKGYRGIIGLKSLVNKNKMDESEARALVSSDSIDEYNIFINYCGDYPYIEHIGKENNEKSVFCQNSIH